MKTRRVVFGVAALGLGVVGWALFRPERLWVNKTVHEDLAAPSGAAVVQMSLGATVLASGRFHSVAHESRGMASIHRLPDGKRVLRLTEFETSNGPDVQVYLVAASDANDNDTVKKAGFLHLGALKGNRGDQNYELPDDADLGKYRAVTIWCRRFGVNFGTAPLAPASMSEGMQQAMSASSSPVVLSTGHFHGVAHEGMGTAAIYRLPSGKRVLRFTEFKTSNGPDVQVYLVAAQDASDNDTVKKAGFVHLGALKGNMGDQNYELPDGLDLGKYRAVTIWCRRFGVNFATAPLALQS